MLEPRYGYPPRRSRVAEGDALAGVRERIVKRFRTQVATATRYKKARSTMRLTVAVFRGERRNWLRACLASTGLTERRAIQTPFVPPGAAGDGREAHRGFESLLLRAPLGAGVPLIG